MLRYEFIVGKQEKVRLARDKTVLKDWKIIPTSDEGCCRLEFVVNGHFVMNKRTLTALCMVSLFIGLVGGIASSNYVNGIRSSELQKQFDECQ
jgi:predicted alpha/beta-fold hydrolase